MVLVIAVVQVPPWAWELSETVGVTKKKKKKKKKKSDGSCMLLKQKEQLRVKTPSPGVPIAFEKETTKPKD